MNWENEKLWAGIGVEVNASLSSREMLYKAKLDWEVSKIPSQRPKSHANQETLRFYKAYFDCGNAEIETVGSLDGARIIWSLARLNEDFVMPEKDELKGYILLASRHENREKIEVHFLTLRSASNSMLKISSKARPTVKNSFRRSFKSTLPFLSESSLQFDEDMIQRTKNTIEMGRAAISAHAKEAQLLTEKKVTDQIAETYMNEVFKQDSEDSEEAKKKAKDNAVQNTPNTKTLNQEPIEGRASGQKNKPKGSKNKAAKNCVPAVMVIGA